MYQWIENTSWKQHQPDNSVMKDKVRWGWILQGRAKMSAHADLIPLGETENEDLTWFIYN